MRVGEHCLHAAAPPEDTQAACVFLRVSRAAWTMLPLRSSRKAGSTPPTSTARHSQEPPLSILGTGQRSPHGPGQLGGVHSRQRQRPLPPSPADDPDQLVAAVDNRQAADLLFQQQPGCALQGGLGRHCSNRRWQGGGGPLSPSLPLSLLPSLFNSITHIPISIQAAGAAAAAEGGMQAYLSAGALS